jgi:hypothetical protein
LEGLDFSYESGEHGVPGEEIQFTIIISDPEQDTIEVILQFGDGSPSQYFNLTEYVDGNATIQVSHVFELVGDYEVTLWFTDNKIGILNHTKMVSQFVTIQEVFVPEVVEWDWWDYTSLGIVFAIPVLIVVRMYVLKRRMARLEREGLTLEEARIRSEAKLMDQLLKGGEGG